MQKDEILVSLRVTKHNDEIVLLMDEVSCSPETTEEMLAAAIRFCNLAGLEIEVSVNHGEWVAYPDLETCRALDALEKIARRGANG